MKIELTKDQLSTLRDIVYEFVTETYICIPEQHKELLDILNGELDRELRELI